MSNAYDAYVPTDYGLPSAAFADGKFNVFVLPGTYNESTDIAIPDGGCITGAGRGRTIIDFGGNVASLTCSSDFKSVETGGTVTLTQGSASVLGSGTTFTNMSVGQFLILHSNSFQIGAIIDNTHLTLENVYNGISGTGV